uniref:Uncharacterized protein n=1 Tax=Trichuris muris TaxID=70415 RepID=A0A5S6QBL4_TRIMR
MVPDGDLKRLAAGRKFLYEGVHGSTVRWLLQTYIFMFQGHFHRAQVGAEEGSRSHILMEPWVYENGILFPKIRDKQQQCGRIAETPA